MLLNVDNLHISFKTDSVSLVAVDDISFAIQRGETFCLVGESGSGKSVTAMSLLQLLPANADVSSGSTIRLYKPDTTSEELSRASKSVIKNICGTRVAMIFQEPMTSLNPVFTVGEQIVEAIQLSQPDITDDIARQRAIDALRDVKIDRPERRVDEYPHRLSGGQRQRVMIAMAMACEPDLLIADEPTTALDVTVQAEILELMRSLQKRSQMSILFITHDLGVVAQIADKIAVMQRGKIVEQGLRKSLLKFPVHSYTKQLLNSLPENLPNPYRLSENSTVQNNLKETLLYVDDVRVHNPVRGGVFHRVNDYVKAVDGVDLAIKRGEIIALVGESGCGKTTLARSLLHLVKTTSGSIYFDGEDIATCNAARMKQLRVKLQYIFQDPASSLNPRLSVATTLVEPMAAHGIGESHEHRLELARKLLCDVQLEPEHLWRFPYQFSGGQRQRIGIARALSLNPEFIVCDEITSALDVSVQAGVLQLLLSLRERRNLTLLFITHDIGVVEYISDKTAVMHKGKIIEIGDTAQICGQPITEYTKKLISSVPRISALR